MTSFAAPRLEYAFPIATVSFRSVAVAAELAGRI